MFGFYGVLFFVSCQCKGVEVGNQGADVWIVGVGFESELVFEGDGEGEDHVYGCYLGEEIFFGELGTLVDVYPDVTREVPRLDTEGGPGFAAVGVSFVRCGAAEGEGETDNETEDCEEEGVDCDWRVVSRLVLEREEGDVRGYTNFEIQVMQVAHAPVMAKGRIIRGVTEPWRRMK